VKLHTFEGGSKHSFLKKSLKVDIGNDEISWQFLICPSPLKIEQNMLREAFKKKETAKIVTLSLSDGRGVSQNSFNKTNYYRDIHLWRGVFKP